MDNAPVPERDHTRGVCLFMRMEVASQAEVADLKVTVVGHQQIWKLQVPRHDPVGMQIVNRLQQLHKQ